MQRFAIATISFLDADLTLFDFLKEDAFELIMLDRYWAIIIKLWDRFNDLKSGLVGIWSVKLA